MMDENDIIKQKLIERSADLDVARQRWFFAFGTSALLFIVVLAIFLLPISETASEEGELFTVDKENFERSGAIDVFAVPSTYWINFQFEMDTTAANEHNRVFIYLYKDDVPDLSIDVTGTTSEELRSYLRSTSFRNGSVTFTRTSLEWDLAFRDADTSRYYVVLYNPDNPDDPYDNLESEVDMTVSYEPLLPLVPIFFILAFIIVLPLMIIRVYVINQKKKELRVLLSLDLENLSNEDKVRLGIPLSSGENE